ncbi:MAG: hypothetical protein ACREJB_12800 [Planctomycetaceae bacterium]
MNNSHVLTDVKETFFNGNPDYFKDRLAEFVARFHMDFNDIKDLSVAALVGRILVEADTNESRSQLHAILQRIKCLGMADKKVAALGLGLAESKNMH